MQNQSTQLLNNTGLLEKYKKHLSKHTLHELSWMQLSRIRGTLKCQIIISNISLLYYVSNFSQNYQRKSS